MAIGERKKCTREHGRNRETAEEDGGNWANLAKKGGVGEGEKLGEVPSKMSLEAEGEERLVGSRAAVRGGGWTPPSAL